MCSEKKPAMWLDSLFLDLKLYAPKCKGNVC